MAEELIGTGIKVDFDVAAALKNIRELSSSIANLGNAMTALEQRSSLSGLTSELSRNFSTSVVNVKTSVKSFSEALETNKLSLGEYIKYGASQLPKFSGAFAKENSMIEKLAKERVKILQTQYVAMGKSAEGYTKSLKAIPNELSSIGQAEAIAIQKSQIFHKILQDGTTSLVNWGKNMQWAGRQIMVGFTVPLALASAKAKAIFADLESEVLRFKRVYGDMFTTPADADKAAEDMKRLANEMTKYGIAVKDTMKMAADAAAAGKQGAELRSAVTEAVRLAVLGEVDQQEALKTTIALQNAYKISSQDLAGTIDYLNAVENQSVLSIQDITAAIPKLGPVVQQLGGNIKDTTVFLAAMRESGISAEQGANALKSGLASLINPTNRAKEAVGSLGGGIEKMVKDNEGDLMGMVTTFANAINTLGGLEKQQVLEKVFGKFQYARIGALLDALVTKGSQANQVLGLAQESALSLAALSNKELKAIETNPVTKLAAAFEHLRQTVAPIGESITRGIIPIVKFADTLA